MLIGVDFGGSLIKVSSMILTPEGEKIIEKFQKHVTHSFVSEQGKFVNFLFKKKFHWEFFDFLKMAKNEIYQDTICSTGGGSFSFKKIIEQHIQPKQLIIMNEFKTIIEGIRNFNKILNDFVYSLDIPNFKKNYLQIENLYPFLLANIGTGISMNKITKSESLYISGTPLGGGSFVGFGKQLFKEKQFHEFVKIVEDQYKIKKCNLNLTNSFENYFKSQILEIVPKIDDHNFEQKKEFLLDFYIHLIRNLCQISFFNAQKLDLKSVVYTGNFLKDNNLAKQMISEFFEQISEQKKYKVKPIFLEVEGFLGSYTCLNIELKKRIQNKSK